MQVQKSSFQKINILVSFVFLLLSLNQCTADTVWGVSRPLFQQRLIEGQREFIGELRIEERNLAEAFRLGPGAPFYLSQILLSLDRAAAKPAEQLLELQWRRGDSPWREEAALQLIRRYLQTERYGEAQTLSRQLSRRAREPGIELQAKRLFVEALYWQEKDEEVLSALKERESEQAPWDDELDLFRAVSSQRLQIPGWQQLFIDLFFDKRSSGLHARAYAYLEQEDRLASFPPAVSLFFQGKDLLYRGQNTEAIEQIEKSLRALEFDRPDMEIVIRELAAAYLAAARHWEGAETLLDLSVDLSPPQRLAAIEMAGRLYRKSGELLKAKRLLSEVVRDTEDPQQRDRAIWFLLDMAASGSSGQLLESIAELAPQWHEPQYFSDLLEPEISALVARRDWTRLFPLYRSLQGYGPPDTMARLAFLVGRLVSLGLTDASAIPLSPQALYLEAGSAGPSYYRFLAETALVDMGFPVRWNLAEADRPLAHDPGEEEGSPEPAAELIRGYFSYGLYQNGMELLRPQWQSVSPELLLEIALVLHDRGEYLHSIRLMSLYAQRKVEGVDRSDLELLYPRAYGEWIDEISKSENLPIPIFFALVREESYFDPAIVSRSGAIGLTQLMSETAADSARWLRMEEYDLRDPQQNLRLGARHFSRLLTRLEDVPKALMAYNAGLSRLRSWEHSFAGLPSDLLAEAAPYPETRNYIRKVVVSAVYYGALYHDSSPEQTVLLFFPGLEQ